MREIEEEQMKGRICEERESEDYVVRGEESRENVPHYDYGSKFSYAVVSYRPQAQSNPPLFPVDHPRESYLS